MEYHLEFKATQVMASYHRWNYGAAGMCALAIGYLIYLQIFKMDHMIGLVVGQFASLLLTASVFVVYFLMAAMVILMRFRASMVLSETLAEECDPYLYEACLSRLSILFYKDRMACRYAMAQFYQGDFPRAWDTLRHINVYKLKGRFKLSYYILLSALHFKNGMGADVAGLEQAYRAGISRKKEQQWFRILCAGNNLLRAMENHDYEAAFRFLKEREELGGKLSCRFDRILYNMKEAEICLALGDKKSAELKLRYVAENGGRLSCAEEARKMLEAGL